MSKIDRRQLLAAAPAAGFAALVAGAVPAGATCSMPVETPMLSLFREWMRLEREEEGIADMDDLQDDDPRFDAVKSQKSAVIQQMRDAPKQGIADLALCVMADTEFGLFGTGNHRWRDARSEARALVGA